MLECNATLAKIERLQDEVLARLDELNDRVEALLRAETQAELGLKVNDLAPSLVA